MAPGIVIPQYTHINDKKESAEWNMDSALDFDLLAEYLLEDVGAGGFDFRYVRIFGIDCYVFINIFILYWYCPDYCRLYILIYNLPPIY